MMERGAKALEQRTYNELPRSLIVTQDQYDYVLREKAKEPKTTLYDNKVETLFGHKLHVIEQMTEAEDFAYAFSDRMNLGFGKALLVEETRFSQEINMQVGSHSDYSLARRFPKKNVSYDAARAETWHSGKIIPTRRRLFLHL